MLDNLLARRTSKVIGDCNSPADIAPLRPQSVADILQAAGNAPFHYACDRVHQQDDGSPVPWRVASLDTVSCQSLMNKLIEAGDTTKVPNMLASAAHLFLVSWLPDDGTIKGDPRAKDGPVFEGTLRNMEHLSAASAFCQSLLLGGTGLGYRTYWSSGGPLRAEQVFEWLDIPDTQLLAGAIFFFPQDVGTAEIKPGALAEKRGSLESWARKITLD